MREKNPYTLISERRARRILLDTQFGKIVGFMPIHVEWGLVIQRMNADPKEPRYWCWWLHGEAWSPSRMNLCLRDAAHLIANVVTREIADGCGRVATDSRKEEKERHER